MTGPCAEGTGVFNITLCALNGIDVAGTLDYTVVGYIPSMASDALINIPEDVDTYANIVYTEISGEIGLLYAIRIYDYAGNSVGMALSGISPEQSVSDMLEAHTDDNAESGRRLWTINEDNGNMTAASTGSVSGTYIVGTSEMKYYLPPTSEDVDPSIRQISLDLGGDLVGVERDVLLETSDYFVMATEIPFDAMGPETSESAWVLFFGYPEIRVLQIHNSFQQHCYYCMCCCHRRGKCYRSSGTAVRSYNSPETVARGNLYVAE